MLGLWHLLGDDVSISTMVTMNYSSSVTPEISLLEMRAPISSVCSFSCETKSLTFIYVKTQFFLIVLSLLEVKPLFNEKPDMLVLSHPLLIGCVGIPIFLP